MQVEEIEYGPDIREGTKFGRGELHGLPHLESETSSEEMVDLARRLGWSNGCTRAIMLTDPPISEYGPEKMIKHFCEVNSWFTIVLSRAQINKPDLAFQLELPTPRLKGELPGDHEPLSVPKSYLKEMAPMVHPFGYAIPRVVVEMKRIGLTHEALGGVITEAIKRTASPIALLTHLTAAASASGVDAITLLRQVLSADVLKEENCHTAFKSLLERFGMISSVYMPYIELTPQDKANLGIAEIDIEE